MTNLQHKTILYFYIFTILYAVSTGLCKYYTIYIQHSELIHRKEIDG